MGHEERFPTPRLSGRCQASQETSPAREARAKHAASAILMGGIIAELQHQLAAISAEGNEPGPLTVCSGGGQS